MSLQTLIDSNHLQSPRWKLHDSSPQRKLIRQALQLQQPLQHRQVVFIDQQLHCDCYTAKNPDAPLILFLAGIGTYCELYAQLLCAINQSGFHVVGIDLPGHGYSEGERGAFTVPEVIEGLRGVLDWLEPVNNFNIAVYGYSIGATLAASLAVVDDRVQALMGSTMLLPEVPPDLLHQFGWNWTGFSAFWWPGIKIPLQQFLDFEGLLAHTGVADEIRNDPLLVTEYPLKTLSSLFNSDTGLTTCERKIPIAILHGDQDEVLPLSYSQKVSEQCSLQVELIVAKGQGHMLPWDDVELNAQLVSAWLHQVL